jgi:hypothetical protein
MRARCRINCRRAILKKSGVWLLVALLILILINLMPSATAASSLLQETGIVATVTGTPEGPMILVPDQVNVRLGPDVAYDKVGVLISGQRVPVVGRSPGGEWLQIVYPGVPGNLAWVFTPLVRLQPPTATLPIAELPPTPTPPVTATIDPTLAAQFIGLGVQPTRLPTFTPASAPVQPTLVPGDQNGIVGFPPVLAILGLFVIGLFGIVISILRGG